MRKLVRFFVYLFVIAGAYYFFKWVGSGRDNDDHQEHVSVEVHTDGDHDEAHHHDDRDGHRHSIKSSQMVEVESFNKLSVSGAYEVHLTQGEGKTIALG
ncbi:MAG: hypothetical protein AAFN10_29135, partial [Bacteroidota bacterium]